MRRYDELIAYQSEKYARAWLTDVQRVHRAGHGDDLTSAVARNLYKLMAYKDEYEVARLTGDATFAATVADEFGDDAKTSVRLHPPMLREMGMRSKISLGAWADPALASLARMKRLRGTRFDPFGRADVRRMERELIVEYRDAVDRVLGSLGTYPAPERVAAATAIADLPDMVRGYEGVKTANVERYRAELERQLSAL